MIIPFSLPNITKEDKEYILDALDKYRIAGDGQYTRKATEFMEKAFSIKKALLTTSCTAALEMAVILSDIKAKDEVILPSFTFVSTANALMMRSARPVFADIKYDTLNIDPEDIENKITDRTKAIIVVHYAGVACDMERIMGIAQRHNLKIIEDAAQGVNAKYKNRYLGTIGDFGCYSFHETKNYTCGEGGAILINNDDRVEAERAEIIREKGTNRSKFFRGEVDKYTWVDIGSSYLPSDILASLLYSQLQRMDAINEKRKMIFNYYYNSLVKLQGMGLLRLPFIPEYCTTNYHIFYLLLNSTEERDNLMFKLKERGITAVFHYIPLHSSPIGKQLGYKDGDLPITESVSARLLRLPLYPDLKESEIEYIVKSIYEIMI